MFRVGKKQKEQKHDRSRVLMQCQQRMPVHQGSEAACAAAAGTVQTRHLIERTEKNMTRSKLFDSEKLRIEYDSQNEQDGWDPEQPIAPETL